MGDLDRYPEAIATAKRVRQLAARAGSLVRLAQAQSAPGQLLFGVGRWDDAQADVEVLPDGFKDPEPSAVKIGNRIVTSLALARSLDHEIAAAPTKALAVLTAGVTNNAEERRRWRICSRRPSGWPSTATSPTPQPRSPTRP